MIMNTSAGDPYVLLKNIPYGKTTCQMGELIRLSLKQKPNSKATSEK